MKSNAGSVVAVAGSCIAAGALVGGATNMVNGAVSPLLFRNTLNWQQADGIWRAAVAMGIFQGLLYGILFAAVFTAVVAATTRGECPYRYAAAFLLRVVVCVLGCWVAGGLVAMGLAGLSPEFYRRTFPGVPEAMGPMLGYAWVGGSIWGAVIGAILSVILAPIVFRSSWRRRVAEGGVSG